MYKLNLQNENESNWIGSKIVKRKYLSTMQQLRNLKFKKYPFWRIDKKNLQIIDGGWHFSFLQSPEQILEKIKSYSHGEFNDKSLDLFDRNIEYQIIKIDDTFPDYIKENKQKFKEWIL